MDKSYLMIDYLVITEIAQTILLIFIMLVMKRNRRANIFLTLFIMLLSSSLAVVLFRDTADPLVEFIFTLVTVPGFALGGMLIYYYSGIITGMIGRLRLLDLVNGLPFALIATGICVFVDPSVSYLGGHRPSVHGFIFGLSILISLVYILIAAIRLKRFELRARNFYSDYTRASVGWVKRILFLSLLFMGVWNAGFWYMVLGSHGPVPEGMFVNLSLFILMIFVTAYHVVNQPEIFRDSVEMKEVLPESGGEPAVQTDEKRKKYERQNISDAMQRKYLTMLEDYIDKEKPYLNEELTIKDLSDLTGIPVHHLSITINNRKKMNFYTFINEYRVSHVIRILEDPANSESNVLSIAYRSGFNSKSTFNDAFKRITGMTPSEYRLQSRSVS